MIDLKHKYSKDDREKIFFHLSLALKLVFGVGVFTLVLGYINYKPFVCLLGAFLSFCCVLIQFILHRVEIGRRIKVKRNQIIERTKLIDELLEKANVILLPIREELSKKSSNTLESNTKTSLNYLSLERVIEALTERLDQIAELSMSRSEQDLEVASALLDKNLVFNHKSTEHLIQHEIPDMPPHTWYDSLRFLLSKVEEDIHASKQF